MLTPLDESLSLTNELTSLVRSPFVRRSAVNVCALCCKFPLPPTGLLRHGGVRSFEVQQPLGKFQLHHPLQRAKMRTLLSKRKSAYVKATRTKTRRRQRQSYSILPPAGFSKDDLAPKATPTPRLKVAEKRAKNLSTPSSVGVKFKTASCGQRSKRRHTLTELGPLRSLRSHRR
jgi:hypothetical protein